MKPVQEKSTKRKPDLMRITITANVVLLAIVLLVLAGGLVIHQSDTNANFCGVCHVMRYNVTSYLTSANLDHVHAEANVQCKDCHDYPLTAEIASGVNFVFGNYTIDENGQLFTRKYGNDMCLRCHISYEKVAQQTDFLVRNPHLSHYENLPCSDCHVSHGKQIDYCSKCHDNGEQRMVGAAIVPRANNPWATGSSAQNPNAPRVEPTQPAQP